MASNFIRFEVQWCSCANYGTPQLALNPSLYWAPKDVNSIEASLTLSTTVLCRQSTPSVKAPRQLCTSSAVPTPNSPNDPVCNLQFEGSGVHVFIAEDVSLCALLVDNNQPQSMQSQIVKNVESCNFARGSPGMTVTGRLCPSHFAASQAGCPAGHV